MSRTNECGHPERKHKAKGLCEPCYWQTRKYTLEQKAHRKIYMKAYDKTRSATPDRKTSEFIRKHPSFSYRDVLPWFTNPDRTCWMCHQPGGAHLDHDHVLRKIRGWTHARCNQAEGLVRTSPDPIALAATYLQLALGAQQYYTELNPSRLNCAPAFKRLIVSSHMNRT